MLQAAALILASLISAFVVMGSAPRRRLRLIREESETLDALPEGHPSRDILTEAITRSAEGYRRYWKTSTVRLFLYAGTFFVVIGAVGLAVAEAGIEHFKHPNPTKADNLRLAHSLHGNSEQMLIVGYVLVMSVAAIHFGWEYAQKNLSIKAWERLRQLRRPRAD